MDTWLIYRLTGGVNGGKFVTDISNAARTNLMDIRSRQWHQQTCKHFGLEADMLPEIKSNAEVFGHVKDGPLQGKSVLHSWPWWDVRIHHQVVAAKPLHAKCHNFLAVVCLHKQAFACLQLQHNARQTPLKGHKLLTCC